jgi:hypothetical protein
MDALIRRGGFHVCVADNGLHPWRTYVPSRAPRGRGLCVWCGGLGMVVVSAGVRCVVFCVAWLGGHRHQGDGIGRFRIEARWRDQSHTQQSPRRLTEEGQDGRRAVEELHGCLGVVLCVCGLCLLYFGCGDGCQSGGRGRAVQVRFKACESRVVCVICFDSIKGRGRRPLLADKRGVPLALG